MNKLKKGFLLMAAFVYGSALFAQSIDDGKKLFFYEKYQSAKTLVSQLVSANANNIDAVYWLGQAEIALDDTASAKTLYQNALMANSGSPLLLVGMGHIALLENQAQDAHTSSCAFSRPGENDSEQSRQQGGVEDGRAAVIGPAQLRCRCCGRHGERDGSVAAGAGRAEGAVRFRRQPGAGVGERQGGCGVAGVGDDEAVRASDRNRNCGRCAGGDGESGGAAARDG